MNNEELLDGLNKVYPGAGLGPPYPEWMTKAHSYKKSTIITRTCSYDDWGYRSEENPLQIVIQASGWKARVLAFLFRIKPCYYTGSKRQCWPKPELL